MELVLVHIPNISYMEASNWSACVSCTYISWLQFTYSADVCMKGFDVLFISVRSMLRNLGYRT